MSETYNIYCDESCHLEHDGQPAMVLGAVWCPVAKTREIADRIREIKLKYGLPATFEIKWTKTSPAKGEFYHSILDYFFDDDDLHFRALVIPDKSQLRHEDFEQDHDSFYYKMYFDLLKVLLEPDSHYHIYLDIKDTRSASKVRKLAEILSNNMHDFQRRVIEKIQLVRSEEVQLIQLADFLIGIVSYANRSLTSSATKTELVRRMRQRSRYTLTGSTLLRENKVNILRWQAQVRR